MFHDRSAGFLVAEISVIILGGFLLWFKILLPIGYYFVAALLAALIAVQVLTNGKSKTIVFQIALLFLFMNSVYYISTNYTIIPFTDGNWDYAVVETFMQKGEIFQILTRNLPPADLLQWYSGWPILHSLTLSLSSISGVDVDHICLVLPLLVSMVSFLFIYLIIEKVRVSLGLNVIVTHVGLLIFATSAEAQFWQIQFVRQNLALLVLFATIYTILLAGTSRSHSLKYKMLAVFFAMTAVMVHNLTSLTMVFFLFLLFVVQAIWEYIGRHGGRDRMRNVFRISSGHVPAAKMVTLGMLLLTAIFLLLWWDSFGSKAWSTVSSTLQRLIQLFSGVREIEYMPRPAYYPVALTPAWATSLLRLRDILTYAPALFGFLLILFRSPKNRHVSFLICASLSFGVLFVLNNFLFRVEVFRTLMMASPFVALLGAVFIVNIAERIKHVGRSAFIAAFLMILVFSSFVGLWGHNFAPIHIYDPSKESIEIGERNTDFMRVNDFFEQRVPVNRYQVVLVDDDASLVHLLQPDDYIKIKRFLPAVPTHSFANVTASELACELKDFNFYSYFSGPASQIKNSQDAMTYKSKLVEYCTNYFNGIYDDGKYRFWVSEVH